jgi:uncharacterized protein
MANRPRSWLPGTIDAAVTAHLQWIYRVTSTRPSRVLLVSLVLLILSSCSILGIRFESDVFKLFPSQQGALRLFLDTLNWSGSAREAYFLLEGERGELLREAETFAAKLKALRIDGEPAFTKVLYRTFDPAEATPFASFVGYAVTRPQLFLAPDQVPDFVARLSPGNIDRALKRDQAELASQSGMAMRDLIAADPLYLRDLILPRLKKGSQSLDLDPESPYFLSRDGRVLIVLSQTARTVQGMEFARKLVQSINSARRGFSVHISCTGAHLSAVIDEATMKGNILACIGSSLVVVLALFYLTYRRVLPTLLIPLILLFGVALALGSAGLFLGSIHIISFAFMALIIGLGTDYSIHIYDRFYSERAAGTGFEESLKRSVVDTGHGIFTAAATTAIPFLGLMVSDVRALFELGLLVGLGVIFSMYATFFFLPPLLIYTERRFPGARYTPLPGFGLGAIWSFSRALPVATVCISLLLIAGLLAASFFVKFEADLKNLQPRKSEAFLTQEKIEKHLSLSPKQMLVAVEGGDLEEVMSRGSRVEALLERYRLNKQLADYSSLQQVINDRVVQERVLAKLAARLGAEQPGRELRRALERNGFTLEPFQPMISGLDALSSAAPVSSLEALARLSSSPLRGVSERHLMTGDGRYHLLFYLYYRGAEFNQSLFLRDLAAVDRLARVTSADLVSAQLESSVRRSFAQAFAFGGIIVIFLLISHFRSLSGVFFTLFPVVAGVIAMLGFMVLSGMHLNFMNAMVLVTILGMGSDYGLHLVHRVTAAGEGDRRSQFVQSGRAVFLSALTTIAGFGSLAFSDYGALASIGSATNFGVGATAFFALVSLPAFMALWQKR